MYKKHKRAEKRAESNQVSEKEQTMRRIEKGCSSMAEKKAKLMKEINAKRKQKKNKDEDDSEWEDVDEHEKEVY